MKHFKFDGKIEDMSSEKLKERIKEVYNMEMPKIIPIPYIGKIEEVTYKYPELTALCPMTGIQDLYTITIKITPNEQIPELKSLKFYFLGYKDLPISHEHLCSKIYEDIKKTIDPSELQIDLDVAVRGGIETTIKIVDM